MAQVDVAALDTLRDKVVKTVNEVEITDIHTHLYTEQFGDLLLWGIDELITYHYLVAETMRWQVVTPEEFWKMGKTDQADLVWKTLFVDHAPYSEACRGVLTVLDKLGLDVASRDLKSFRKYFADQKVGDYISTVFKTANVKDCVMTNDPFDDLERPVWLDGIKEDPRFHAALRLDGLLMDWKAAVPRLQEWGYEVAQTIDGKTIKEVRRFLSEWISKMKPVYMAVSLPPTFTFPDASYTSRLISECILPISQEKNIPFALMIGVKKLTNPALKLAGDSVGKSIIETVEYLCANYPENKFLVTMLARENQHELSVAARKFGNLMIFGCWWYLNNPVLIEEMTRMRFELLGGSIVPQHSDCRVLDQMIYKWSHSREIIGKVLADKMVDIARTGWMPTDEEIKKEAQNIFGGNFWSFLAR